MNNLNKFIQIADFLGTEMTATQSKHLIDDAKKELSIADLQTLKNYISGPLYTNISMYEGEIGGFDRY